MVKYTGDCNWLYMPEWFETDRDIEIVCDIVGEEWVPEKDTYKIFIDFNEPDFYLATQASDVEKRVDEFDLLVTRRPELLKYPNAKCMLMGPSWLSDDFKNNPDSVEKYPSISFTNTGKAWATPSGIATGYDFRRKINENWYDVLNAAVLPVHFYNSTKQPIFTPYDSRFMHESYKDACFQHMFHIGIENSSHPNYVTERLLDCFSAKVMPVYYGMTNVGDYFDTDGVIQVTSYEELIDVLPTLTPDLYCSKKEVMDKNYELAKKWWDTIGNFWNIVGEEICKK